MLTDEQLLSSPLIRNIVSRVQASGYAKTAAAVIFNVEEPTLPAMLQSIGTKLASDMHRHGQIRIGLASLSALSNTDGLKQANFLSDLLKRSAPGGGRQAVMQQARKDAPEIFQNTHLLGTDRGAMGVSKSVADSMGDMSGVSSVEIPAYARTPADGGTFVPKELPVQPKRAPDAPEGLRTKARPTQQFDMPELPAMFQRSEGLGAPQRAISMGQGGKGILPESSAPGGATSFAGMGAAPQGGAPSMFNLADLMKGNKTAGMFTPEPIPEGGRDATFAESMVPLWAAHTSPEGKGWSALGRGMAGNFLGGTAGTLAGAGLGSLVGHEAGPMVGALAGRLAGEYMGGKHMLAPIYAGNSAAGTPPAPAAADAEMQGKAAAWRKFAGIDLKALMANAKPAEDWRSVSSLLQNVPSATPLSPKLKGVIQGAHAPSPFSSLQPVPSQSELAGLMAGNKLAASLSIPGAMRPTPGLGETAGHALMGAIPGAIPAGLAYGASKLPGMDEEPELASDFQDVSGTMLGGSMLGSALGSIPGLMSRNPGNAMLGSALGGSLGLIGGSVAGDHSDAGKRLNARAAEAGAGA